MSKVKLNPVEFAKLMFEAHGKKPMTAWHEDIITRLMRSPVPREAMSGPRPSWKNEAVYWISPDGFKMYDGETVNRAHWSEATAMSAVDWGRPGGDCTVKVTAERQPDGTVRLIEHTVSRSEMYIDDPHTEVQDAIARHVRDKLQASMDKQIERAFYGVAPELDGGRTQYDRPHVNKASKLNRARAAGAPMDVILDDPLNGHERPIEMILVPGSNPPRFESR